jgi:hypothetical protein
LYWTTVHFIGKAAGFELDHRSFCTGKPVDFVLDHREILCRKTRGLVHLATTAVLPARTGLALVPPSAQLRQLLRLLLVHEWRGEEKIL